MTACDCKTCQEGRWVQALAETLPPKDAEFLWDMASDKVHVESELNWYQAVTDGSWPDAEVIIEGWLERVRNPETTKPAEAGSEGQGA